MLIRLHRRLSGTQKRNTIVKRRRAKSRLLIGVIGVIGVRFDGAGSPELLDVAVSLAR